MYSAVMRLGRMGSTALVLTLRTVGETASVLAMVVKICPTAEPEFCIMVARSMLNLAAAALNGCPSAKATSSRRVKSQVVSSTRFQAVASQGVILPLTSGMIIGSNAGEL